MAATATPVSNSQLRSPVNISRHPGTSASSLVFSRSRNPSGNTGSEASATTNPVSSGPWIFDGTQIPMTTTVNPDAPRWTNNGRRSKPPSGPGKPITLEVKNRIFIGGLQSNMNEDDLRTLFGEYGDITEVLIKERGTQDRRGFGFITYGNKPGRTGDQAAEIARKEGADERLEIHGVKINVQRAYRIVHTNEERNNAPGGAQQQPQISVMPFMPPMPFMPMMNPAAFYPPQYFPYGFPDMYGMNRGLPSSGQYPGVMPGANPMWPMQQGQTPFANPSPYPALSYPPAMQTPPPDANPVSSYQLRTPTHSASRNNRDLEASGGGRSVASSNGRRADGRVPGIRISDYDDDEDLTVRLGSLNLDGGYNGQDDFGFSMGSRGGRLV